MSGGRRGALGDLTAGSGGRRRRVTGYTDGGGKRRFKQFATKREADGFLTRTKSEVAAGAHIPDRLARTVDHAYGLLIATLKADDAARSGEASVLDENATATEMQHDNGFSEEMLDTTDA